MDMSSMSGTVMGSTSLSMSPTSTGMIMPSSSSSSMSESMTMPMSAMSMTFFTSTLTPLYSSSWTPTNTAQYAGTIIFLIVLTVIFRCLLALKAFLEYTVWTTSRGRERVRSNSSLSDMEAKDKTLKLRAKDFAESQKDWKADVDAARALMDVLIVGVSYLLGRMMATRSPAGAFRGAVGPHMLFFITQDDQYTSPLESCALKNSAWSTIFSLSETARGKMQSGIPSPIATSILEPQVSLNVLRAKQVSRRQKEDHFPKRFSFQRSSHFRSIDIPVYSIVPSSTRHPATCLLLATIGRKG
ncbi:MAG: hypothetical protein Q9227_003205 [Pyrenula ochraceoflavens]